MGNAVASDGQSGNGQRYTVSDHPRNDPRRRKTSNKVGHVLWIAVVVYIKMYLI